MTKHNADYRSGYGQARADFLRELKRAIQLSSEVLHAYLDLPAPYFEGHLTGLKNARALAKGLKAEQDDS